MDNENDYTTTVPGTTTIAAATPRGYTASLCLPLPITGQAWTGAIPINRHVELSAFAFELAQLMKRHNIMRVDAARNTEIELDF